MEGHNANSCDKKRQYGRELNRDKWADDFAQDQPSPSGGFINTSVCHYIPDGAEGRVQTHHIVIHRYGLSWALTVSVHGCFE